MSNIRLADLTKTQFRRAQAQKRLPPQLSLDTLSTDQATALARWATITRRVPLSASASRIAFSMAEQHARAILREPERWLFCAAWIADEPEPACGFFHHAPRGVRTEPDDGLESLVVVPLTHVARDVLSRLDALGHGSRLAVAA